MIGHDLTDHERALIAHYDSQAKAVGFDGHFGLPPHERGVLAVADLVRQQTLLQVFTVLGLGGKAAKEATFGAGGIDVPPDAEAVEARLRKLYEIE